MDPLTRVVAVRLAPLLVALILSAGCHPGPIVDTGAKPPDVGGTISGTVRAEGVTSLVGRKVTATNQATGATVSTTTADNGGYTMKVPAGTWRLDLELRAGETLSTRPDPTQVNVGDLDPDRNFVVTVRR